MDENPSRIKKYFGFIDSLKQKRILNLIIFFVIISAIPLTVFISQQKQEIRQRAQDYKATAWKTGLEAIKKSQIKAANSILEIQINYNQDLDSKIKFGEIVKKSGYAPLYPPKEEGYKLEALDSRNNPLVSINFVIPNQITDLPPLEGEKPAPPQIIKNLDFILTIPWLKNISSLRIVSPKKLVVAAKTVGTVEEKLTTPSFRTIRGDEFLRSKEKDLLNFEINNKAQASSNDYLDVAFIGDKYTDLNVFHNDVNRYIEGLLRYEPFKSRASQILFHYVDNKSDLGCQVSPNAIYCNNSMVKRAVNNSGVPNDSTVVIVNSQIYAGAASIGSNLTVVCSCRNYGPEVFVHEFGHSFGGLFDEYNYPNDDGLIDNKTHANCYGGPPPNDDWLGIVEPQDYYQGCTRSGWYRSSFTSIMKDLSSTSFNRISQSVLSKQLDYYTLGNVPCTTTCRELVKCDPTCDSSQGYYCSADYQTCQDGSQKKTYNPCEKSGGPFSCDYLNPTPTPANTACNTCRELVKCDPTCDSSQGYYCSADYQYCSDGTTKKTYNPCEKGNLNTCTPNFPTNNSCTTTCRELVKCDPTCDSSKNQYCSADYQSCADGSTKKIYNPCQTAPGPQYCNANNQPSPTPNDKVGILQATPTPTPAPKATPMPRFKFWRISF